MATFWLRAARSVYRMFFLYFDLLYWVLTISHFGFEGGTLVLIAPVLVLAYLLLYILSLIFYYFIHQSGYT